MSFDGHQGTRGNRAPDGLFMRWANTMIVRRLRRSGRSKVMGLDTLILHTVGARTGQERVSPVGWFPGPDGSWLICASANAAVNNPAWYYNIAAHPDRITIEVDGATVPVTAEQLHGAEREEAWRQITAVAPRYANYQTRTDRELPVLRLVRRAGPQH